MLTSNLPKYKYFILLLLSLGILGLISIYVLSLPPRSDKDTLKIMKLNKDTAPVFKMESQLLYAPSLLGDLENLLKSTANSANTPDVSAKNINIAINMEATMLETIANDLTSLSSYISRLTLSLLPSDNSDEQTYINLYEELYHLLDKDLVSKTEFILYPQDLSQLHQYNTLTTTYSVGVNINTLDDLNTLDTISDHFKSLRPLYVREDFINTYNGNILETSKEINAFYYTLAIRYPQFTGIFSSFLKNSLALEDNFSLKSSDPNYTAYQNIYGRLLREPWLTIQDVPLGSTSPYSLLDSYDKITGIEELLLSPESTLVTNIFAKAETTSKINFIHYKLEEQELSIQNYYPYVVQIDTTAVPNGVTRFKALVSDNNGEIIEVQSIDLVIENQNTLLRAKRSLDTSSFNSTPSYQSEYIPILMYHSVVDYVAPENNNNSVETQLFDAQMKALIDNGYTPINFKVLHDYLNGKNGLPEKPILITMDDGYLNNYTNAYPIYKKYNIPATLFVSAYYMKEDNTDRHFGWIAAKEMEDSGLIDIQSHGYNHTPLSYLSLKDVRYHISHSRGLIEKYLGPRDVFVVAYPQFRNTIYTRKLLSELNVDFQITKLAERGTGLNASNLKRINVPNTMSPEELISTLEKLTQ